MGDATGPFVLEVVPWFYCQEMLDSGPGFSKLARLGGHAKAASGTHMQWAGAVWMQAACPGAGSQDLPGGLHVLHSPLWLQEVW